jgi:cation:H+ antiporter
MEPLYHGELRLVSGCRKPLILARRVDRQGMQLLFFVLGLVGLLGGAELLVRGASRLSLGLGISPLVVGLTVVAFGTSSPELAVSVAGSWSGNSAMAVGNVVGSNVFNVLLILGLSAVITPMVVQRQIVRLEAPILLGASILVAVLCVDGAVGRVDGIGLALLLAGYTTFTVVRSRQEGRANDIVSEEDARPTPWGYLRDGLFIVVGLGLLVVGSDLLVDGAVAFARRLGIPEVIIALTIISAGTSLPEVATSITAALRGQRDIAVGNVVGSNVFNLLGVLGLSAAVAPAPLELTGATLSFDIPVMVGVAVLVLPIVFTGHRIDRWEGAVLLAYYAAYVGVLILRAVESIHLRTATVALAVFVVPMTLLTLGIFVVRELQARRKHNP